MKLLYKIVFGLSILFDFFALITLVSSIKVFINSYGHNLLDISSLFGFLFALGIFLALNSLSVITYFYIKNPSLTNKLSNSFVVLSGIVLILILIWRLAIFSLLIASGGLLALIPGIFSLSSLFTEIFIATCVLIYIGLIFSYIKVSSKKKMKSAFFILVILLIIIPWYGTSLSVITESKVTGKDFFLGAAEKVTTRGSTDGWRVYENSQTGISFKYPLSWPVATHGYRGAENPYDIYFQEPRKPIVAEIEIGQMTSDGRTCGDCVSVSPEQITEYLNGMIEFTSPGEKFTVHKLYINEKEYTSYSFDRSEGKNSWIIVPNPITPNHFAIVKFQTPVNENTKYLFVDSFVFKK